MEKIMCLNFVKERTQKCDRENREWRWRQIKSIYRLHLDLAVKQLCYNSCLNAWATNAPLSEIKSYVLVLSFYIKMMKRRTLQACSFWHSIKKVGQGGVLPPFPPCLRACIYHRNIVSEYKLQRKSLNHEIMTSFFTCFFHEKKTNVVTCFFNINIKIAYEQSSFLSFMNKFSEMAVSRCSSKLVL